MTRGEAFRPKETAMPDTSAAHLTDRQQAWFVSLRAGLERDTGRTLEQWAEIARACPETKHRARLAWLKAEHGLAQNRASIVLNAAFPPEAGWSEPEALAEALWKTPATRALIDAVKQAMATLPDVITGQRKGFTAFSRKVQFAAARPDKEALLLGLAVPPDAAPGLVPPGKAGWSDRLKSQARIITPEDIAPLMPAIRQAWEAS
jgi:hypothetical protein